MSKQRATKSLVFRLGDRFKNENGRTIEVVAIEEQKYYRYKLVQHEHAEGGSFADIEFTNRLLAIELIKVYPIKCTPDYSIYDALEDLLRGI